MPTDREPDLFGGITENMSATAPTGRFRGNNLLNNLSTREWLISTKSVWYSKADDLRVPAIEQITEVLRESLGDERAERLLGQLFDSVMLSKAAPRDELKAQHPATFPEPDIEKLIKFFSKPGECILDPFLGSGSTLVACQECGRNGIGVELTEKWVQIARERIHRRQASMFRDQEVTVEVKHGDAFRELRRMDAAKFHFIVTSPPYWSMLNKPGDHKIKSERLKKHLPTRYSHSEADLANSRTYRQFLGGLRAIFAECCRVLLPKRYIAVVVSDFRDRSKFYMFHADVAVMLEQVGFDLAGITILVQDSKTLYPYGMPHAFVSNIHHQYVVIARKRGTP